MKCALLYQTLAVAFAISISGCSDSQNEQQASSDVSASSPTVSVPATQPLNPKSNTSSEVSKPKQEQYDPRVEAAAVFQAGSKLSDKDIAWFINAKPGDDKYGLNLYMSHDFFDLPDDEKSSLTQRYFRQWEISLKEAEIKVPKHTTLTINFYDALGNQFVNSATKTE